MSSSVNYGGNDAKSYFGQERPEILSLISGADKRVLDVGCGSGILGSQIKKLFNSYVAGIEFSPLAAEEARKNLDTVIEGDIFKISLPQEEGSFDLIIFADVLEHLTDPAAALNRLSAYLNPNGRIIVSLPNVRHITVVLPLLFKGEWEYKDRGIMDKTHFRFFTKSSSIALLKECNFEITGITANLRHIKRIAVMLDRITFGLLRDFFVQQWIFTARLRK